MKPRFASLWVAGVLAMSSLVAGAQTAAPDAKPASNTPTAQRSGGPMGMKGHQNPARMEAMVAKRHAELKAKLKLAPEQEEAWNRFTQAMKPPAHPDTKRPDPAEMAKLSTPERIDRMSALRKERMDAMNAAMDQRDEAIKTFYAALNPEQKKTFDAEHARMGQQHARRQGMQHRMGRGGEGAPGKP